MRYHQGLNSNSAQSHPDLIKSQILNQRFTKSNLFIVFEMITSERRHSLTQNADICLNHTNISQIA
jgi:hypothetical protein